ncbi:response regulator [Candidatus Saccharibacteria bacterium]|nr:response regulator [Candidatus Saccharibacteria bacterium]
MHVLVIDSDKALRNFYVSTIEVAGYTAVGAASAQSAIGSCEDHCPDVVVLELQLHGHSGVEFLHELRSYPEWQNIPVILHTVVPSKDLHGFEQALKNMRIVAYAYKPETSLKKLVSLINDSVKTAV